MVKGQLLGIPNWIKKKIDELSNRVGNNENTISQMNSDIALNKQTLGYECKNLIPYPYHHGNSRTTYGITFNVSNDGVITANGTNTGEEVSDFYFTNKLIVPAGDYCMTYNNDVDENISKCTVSLYDGTTWIRACSNSDGGKFTITEEESAKGCTLQIYVRIYKGKTVNNLTFKPMLRRVEITDDTYEVYKPSVDARIDKLDADISAFFPDVINVGVDMALVGHVVCGANLIIPVNIPPNYIANVRSVEVYINGSWNSVQYNKYIDKHYIRQLQCDGISVSTHAEGYPVLCRIDATFTKNI